VGETVKSAAPVSQLGESPDEHACDDQVESPGGDDPG